LAEVDLLEALTARIDNLSREIVAMDLGRANLQREGEGRDEKRLKFDKCVEEETYGGGVWVDDVLVGHCEEHLRLRVELRPWRIRLEVENELSVCWSVSLKESMSRTKRKVMNERFSRRRRSSSSVGRKREKGKGSSRPFPPIKINNRQYDKCDPMGLQGRRKGGNVEANNE